MASGAQLPFPLQGNGALPRYEQLKEEHDLGVVSASASPGVPLGSTAIPMPLPQVYGRAPRDHLAWSLFNTLYMNFCCLGFMALVFSVKARDRKVIGDHSGAGSYGSTAKCLNIMALLLSLLSTIIFIILVATGVIAIASLPQ